MAEKLTPDQELAADILTLIMDHANSYKEEEAPQRASHVFEILALVVANVFYGLIENKKDRLIALLQLQDNVRHIMQTGKMTDLNI